MYWQAIYASRARFEAATPSSIQGDVDSPQLAAARAAAVALIASGTVGNPAGEFEVTLFGFSQDPEGHSDRVSVHVTSRQPPP